MRGPACIQELKKKMGADSRRNRRPDSDLICSLKLYHIGGKLTRLGVTLKLENWHVLFEDN